MPPYREVSPEEVRLALERGDAVCLVDVRQPWEYENSHIPGALLLPLGDLPRRSSELDASRTTICVCEHGVRSRHAASFLAAQGFEHVATMNGGMAEYHGPTRSALESAS